MRLAGCVWASTPRTLLNLIEQVAESMSPYLSADEPRGVTDAMSRWSHRLILISLTAIGSLGVFEPAAVAQVRGVSSQPRGLSMLPRGVSSIPRAPVGGWGTVRYGGGATAGLVRPAYRALPSQARYARAASGLLPSEIRGQALASGSRVFSGAPARIQFPVPGAVRYSGGLAPDAPETGITSRWRPSRVPGLAPLDRAMPASSTPVSSRRAASLATPTIRYGASHPLGTPFAPASRRNTALSSGPGAGAVAWTSSAPAGPPLGTLRYASASAPRQRSLLGAAGSFGGDRRVEELPDRDSRGDVLIADLPAGAVEILIDRQTYYRVGDEYYELSNQGGGQLFTNVSPPQGAWVESLPLEHDTFVIGGRQYYYNAGVYYLQSTNASEGRFVVVEPPESPSSPNPIRHVREMSDYLAALGSISMTCSVALHEPSTVKKATAAPLQITLHRMRPDKLRADVASDPDTAGFRYAGSRASIFNLASGMYATAEEIDSLDAALSLLAELLNVPEVVVGLLGDDAFEALVTKTRTNDARYLGREDLDNRLCHHLAFQSPTGYWELWLELGDPPLPRRLLVGTAQGQDEARYLLQIRSWEVSAEFTEDFFVYEPSADMKQAMGPTGILPGAKKGARVDDSPRP